MNLSDLKAVIHKELLELLRNWVSLIVALILCASYPAVLFGISGAMQASSSSAKALKVAVEGYVGLVSSAFSQTNVRVEPPSTLPSAERQLLGRKVDAIIFIPPSLSGRTASGAVVPSIKIETTAGQSGLLTFARLGGILEQLRQRIANKRLSQLHLSTPWFTDVHSNSVLAGNEHAGKYVAVSLPLILTVIIVVMSASFSVNCINGERSSRTWQLLLVSALDRNSLLYGKLAATVLTVFLGMFVCLSSMLVCSALAGKAGADLGISFNLPEAILSAVLSVPFAISLSAFFFLLCLCARSTQEAGIFIAAAAIVFTLMPFASAIPSKFVAPALYLVPVVNVSLCISESLQTGLNTGHCLLTWITALIMGAACLYGCTKVLRSESLLFNFQTPAEFRRDQIKNVLVLCAVVFVLFFYFGQVLMAWNIFFGTIAAQMLVLALPGWFAVRRSRLQVKETMRLRPVAWQRLLGSALLAPGVTLLAMAVATAQNVILPMPSEYDKMMKEIILAGHPLWQTLLAMAVAPGIFEEILFRGAILGMLSKSMKPVSACLATGVLFGLFHMSMFRFLPTCIAGIILSAVALSTGSIFPAMILHMIYNTCAILISEHEQHLRWWYVMPAMLSTISGAVFLGWLRWPRSKGSSDQAVPKVREH